MTAKNLFITLFCLLALSLALCGCSQQGEKSKAAEMEQWVKDLDAAWSSHDTEKVLSFYTDDCVYEDVPVNKVARGKEELRTFINEFFAGSTDFRVENKSFFVSDNHICSEWVMSGTHNGNWPGVPATGRTFSVRGISVSELAGDKIKQNADYYDGASFMRQLGLSLEAMAADPHVGTWNLNLAKSDFVPPGSAPKSQILKIEAQDNGIKFVSEGVDAQGKANREEFEAKYDGKDYPYRGSPTADTIAYKKIDANTLDWVVKKAGKVVNSGRSVISADGKIRTVTGTGKDDKGQDTARTSVYEKQE